MVVNDDAGNQRPRGDTETVGASLLAMVVNDGVGCQTPRGVLGFFASKLAPTGDCVGPARHV
jgi:hypothetical protein